MIAPQEKTGNSAKTAVHHLESIQDQTKKLVPVLVQLRTLVKIANYVSAKKDRSSQLTAKHAMLVGTKHQIVSQGPVAKYAIQIHNIFQIQNLTVAQLPNVEKVRRKPMEITQSNVKFAQPVNTMMPQPHRATRIQHAKHVRLAGPPVVTSKHTMTMLMIATHALQDISLRWRRTACC